jgi:hypothetical protein
METALYYTLSTISQTLAGALGMLAAFLALRLSALHATIGDESETLQQRLGYVDPLSLPTPTPDEIIRAHVRRFSAEELRRGGSVGARVAQRAGDDVAARDFLIAAATRAFVISAYVMAACFVGLALAPAAGTSAALAILILAAAIAAAVFCLVLYGRLVLRSLA